MRAVAPMALMLVLAACAPATASDRYTPLEGSRAFTLSVDGRDAPASRGTFTYGTQDIELEVVLNRVSIQVKLANESDSTLRWDVGRSAFVLADGSRSPVVTGGTTWTARDDPQPTVDIPLRAQAVGVLLPRSLLRQDPNGGGMSVDPMFEWPLSGRVTIRLLLYVEIDGREREIALVFDGTPRP